jgi:hypothetical protein
MQDQHGLDGSHSFFFTMHPNGTIAFASTFDNIPSMHPQWLQTYKETNMQMFHLLCQKMSVISQMQTATMPPDEDGLLKALADNDTWQKLLERVFYHRNVKKRGFFTQPKPSWWPSEFKDLKKPGDLRAPRRLQLFKAFLLDKQT